MKQMLLGNFSTKCPGFRIIKAEKLILLAIYLGGFAMQCNIIPDIGEIPCLVSSFKIHIDLNISHTAAEAALICLGNPLRCRGNPFCLPWKQILLGKNLCTAVSPGRYLCLWEYPSGFRVPVNSKVHLTMSMIGCDIHLIFI